MRSLREAAGLTQDALSERCREHGASITQSRISEYENAEKFPGPDNVAALAAALGVTPARLFSVLLAQKQSAAVA